MRKNRFPYIFFDPASGGYSASRVASIFMVIVDALWATMAVLGLPPKDAYGPVSSMLSACTVAAFGAYGANSFAKTWFQGGSVSGAGGGPVQRVKPAPPGE